MKEIHILIPNQRLFLFENQKLIQSFIISTAKNGAGEKMGSEKTPRGKHFIRAKIGAGAPQNAVFVARRFTGEIFNEKLARENPNRDWILSRILWLCGAERGKNRGGNVDTMRRYIYIHGAPDDAPFGTPNSHGCIRMKNADIIALFDSVPPQTPVWIWDDLNAAPPFLKNL